MSFYCKCRQSPNNFKTNYKVSAFINWRFSVVDYEMAIELKLGRKSLFFVQNKSIKYVGKVKSVYVRGFDFILFQQKVAEWKKKILQPEFCTLKEKLIQLILYKVWIRFNAIHSSIIVKSIYMYCCVSTIDIGHLFTDVCYQIVNLMLSNF